MSCTADGTTARKVAGLQILSFDRRFTNQRFDLSQVMQRVLNTMVPRFLAQLRADYALWAAGDESRKPVGDGQI